MNLNLGPDQVNVLLLYPGTAQSPGCSPGSRHNLPTGPYVPSLLGHSPWKRKHFIQSNSFVPSKKLVSSLHCSFSADSPTRDGLTNSETVYQTKNLLCSPNLALSLLFSFSLSITDTLFPFLTKFDQTQSLPVSHHSHPTALNVSSLLDHSP
jgi:hypothetical protein